MKASKEFAESLVEVWNYGGTLLGAIMKTLNLPEGSKLEDFGSAMEGLGVSKFTVTKQPVRAWIAEKFVRANDCLWDGNQGKAISWMVSGKDYERVKKGNEAVKQMKKDRKGLLRVRVRERDTRRAWNVCK